MSRTSQIPTPAGEPAWASQPRATSSGRELVIEVKDLRKTYPGKAGPFRRRKGEVEAVKGVSFSVERGEVYGLLGPNGAGKTTTLEMVEGMRSIDSGTVMVAGVDVRRDPAAARRRIGVQLQEANFFEELKLAELLRFFADLYGVEDHAAELLERVRLTEKAASSYKHLSGGQKRRLSIAVAIVNNPPVVFLDEPTTGLDPHARRGVWQLVEELSAQSTAVVLTTHYIEEAEALCDRVGIMEGGRIVAEGAPRTLIEDLLATGFRREEQILPANLEDVFIQLTGKALVEAD